MVLKPWQRIPSRIRRRRGPGRGPFWTPSTGGRRPPRAADATFYDGEIFASEAKNITSQTISNHLNSEMIDPIDIRTSRHILFGSSIDKDKEDKIDRYLVNSGRPFSLDSYTDLCRLMDDKKIEHSDNICVNICICAKTCFLSKDN